MKFQNDFQLIPNKPLCFFDDSAVEKAELVVFDLHSCGSGAVRSVDGTPPELAGSFVPDFGFAGMYHHPRSGTNVTLFRQYSSQLSRWLSRDPLGEAAGLNLFAYVKNNPISNVDPLGLKDYSAAETQTILNQSAERAIGSNSFSGLAGLAYNSAIGRDYRHIKKEKDSTWCINGIRLDANQFTNFLAGYGAQSWDNVYGHGNFPALGTLKGVGVGWHVLGAFLTATLGPESASTFTTGHDDIFNKRGGADIEAGAWHAFDQSKPLREGSGYRSCGCK